jgi:hypothetical protein
LEAADEPLPTELLIRLSSVEVKATESEAKGSFMEEIDLG